MKSPVTVTHSLLHPWGGDDSQEGVSLPGILGEAVHPSGWRPLSASQMMLHTDSCPLRSMQAAVFPTFSNRLQPNLVPMTQSRGARRKGTITGYLPSPDKTNGNFLFESDTRAPRENMCGAILSFPDHSGKNPCVTCVIDDRFLQDN